MGWHAVWIQFQQFQRGSSELFCIREWWYGIWWRRLSNINDRRYRLLCPEQQRLSRTNLSRLEWQNLHRQLGSSL